MRYSIAVAAVFAAGAMARAVPEGNEIIKVTEIKVTEAPTEKATEKYPTEKYPTEKRDKYETESKYPTEKKDKYYPTEKKDKYETEAKYPKHKEEQEYYPVKKDTYEHKKKSEGDKYKPYFPEPKDYDEEKSCYDHFEWAPNVKADKPCNIKWAPKKGEWKDEDDTVIYIYKCDDYSKPYEKVCHDCGKGEYKEWKPKSDCKPSDAEGGATYRFKFCKKSNEEEYTWGEEFPIWNDEYYKAKPAEKPVENQCPAPVPVPVYEEAPVEKAPEAPAAPVEAAPAYPAAPAPAEAAAPASLAAPTNETAPAPEVAFNGSGALRASISVIVGVAALVTFAL